MNKMTEQPRARRVGVLMGGVSSERNISFKSGEAIAQALDRCGCAVVALDIDNAQEEKISGLLQGAQIDVAFIALHGQLGEDGTIQSILEKLHIPYTGSGVEASRLAINKALSQKLFKKSGIDVPSYVTLSKGDQADMEGLMTKVGGFPVVVKPACEGSSIGITIVKGEEDLKRAIELAWDYDATVLLEKYIEGRELTVSILGEEALPVVEIRPKQGFFDFKAKYTEGMTEYIIPAEIPDTLSHKVQADALKAHHVLGCADFSRVDFMMDARQNIFILELNTIPGFTSTSLLPKAANYRGINFDQLCLKLMETAYGKKEKIKDTTLRY